MINNNENLKKIGYKSVVLDFTTLTAGQILNSDVVHDYSKFEEIYILDFTEMFSTMATDTKLELFSWYLREGNTYEYTKRNFNSVNNFDKTIITKDFLTKNKIIQFAGTDIRRDEPKSLVATKMRSGIAVKLLSGTIPTESPKILAMYNKTDNSWLSNH